MLSRTSIRAVQPAPLVCAAPQTLDDVIYVEQQYKPVNIAMPKIHQIRALDFLHILDLIVPAEAPSGTGETILVGPQEVFGESFV